MRIVWAHLFLSVVREADVYALPGDVKRKV